MNSLQSNVIKSKDKFINLKSDYFLQKLFNSLDRKKALNIIKYTKNLMNRLNINIKDYKEYLEIYSSIEIEIKLVNNKYGKFINIYKGKEKCYHIYFNDNKEEIKRNYINKGENIKIIKIVIDYQIKSFGLLFDGCECVESIYFKKFYRNNIDIMAGMFFGCSSLKELNLNNFNTDNVTNMSCMFYECSSLKKLDLNNFNTKNVTNMSCMFYCCSSLEELNISNFNTNNVTHMYQMFRECSSLKELNLINFNIKNSTNINGMFFYCSYELKMKIRYQCKNIREKAFELALEPDDNIFN